MWREYTACPIQALGTSTGVAHDGRRIPSMESTTIDVRGPLHVADFGGSGPFVLLVHGLGGSHLNWLSVGASLAERNRVLALDLPGFGLSPAAGRRSTVGDNVDVITDVIEQLTAEPVVLVGNSMGGLLSLIVAARRPDRIAGLILVNPALPPPRGRLRMEPALREIVLAFALPWLGMPRMRRVADRAGPEALVLQILRNCCVDLDRVDPDVLRAHVELERRRVAIPGWYVPLQDAAISLLRLLARRSRVERFVRRVSVPTVLMHGLEDHIVSVRSAYAAADLRPDWEFHVLDDVGHVPMLEVPNRFLDAVREPLRRWRMTSEHSHAARDVA